jgi:hypothetical protein
MRSITIGALAPGLGTRMAGGGVLWPGHLPGDGGPALAVQRRPSCRPGGLATDPAAYSAWCERIRQAESQGALTMIYSQLCGLPPSYQRTDLLLGWMLRWRRVAGETPMPPPVS